MAHHRKHDDEEAEEEGAILGVGRPVVGFRNWEGYAAAREGPETRFRDRRGMCAKAQADLLQRWRPELMLDRGSLEEMLREDRCVWSFVERWVEESIVWALTDGGDSFASTNVPQTYTRRADRRARRQEGMWRQGNSLWAPRVAPTYSTSSHAENDDDDAQQQQQERPRRRRRRSRLLVHPGGPALDRLHLSLVHEEERDDDGGAAPRCWMSGGRWAPAGVGGPVRHLAPLNQYEGDDAGTGSGAFPFLGEPPTCFARGTTEATLFQLRRFEDERAELETVDVGAESVSYYVSPVQHLQVRLSGRESIDPPQIKPSQSPQSIPFIRPSTPSCHLSPTRTYNKQFPHLLLDVATRPASVHRAAFLTEALRVYEWSSARGAASVNLELPEALTKDAGAAAAIGAWPAGHQARLAWGAHPRCLWLSSGGALCQLDLRQRVATAFPIDPPRWPVDLLPPTTTAAGPEAGGAATLRGAAAVLRSTAAVTAVGPIERHPLDENLLFVAADHGLLALDLR